MLALRWFFMALESWRQQFLGPLLDIEVENSGPRFVGGGHSGFGPFLNSWVHCVMYLYYFLSACGPGVQKYLGWKRYLTTMQMVQFVLVFIHALQVLDLTTGAMSCLSRVWSFIAP